MQKEIVVFKGVPGGLIINVDSHADINDIKDKIAGKLKSKSSFFKDSYPDLIFNGREFNKDEKEMLTDAVKTIVANSTVSFDGVKKKKKYAHPAMMPKEETMDLAEEETSVDEQTSAEEQTHFLKGMLRNGQKIEYPGNVVVLGDVNPGAEIVAGGNIVVFGNLGGLAHAGAYGDLEAIVAANRLHPIQLRIGNYIARPPEDQESPPWPEMAKVKNNNLVIEPCSQFMVKNTPKIDKKIKRKWGIIKRK